MHAQALEFARRVLADLHVTGHVVEIGSRNLNGSVRPLFVETASYTGVDIASGLGVDVVADGSSYEPLGSQPPSMVVCMEVLEHAPDGKDIVANAARILERGGWLLVTCATEPRAPHSARDGGAIQPGEHYRNVAPSDLRGWLDSAGLELALEEFHTDRGDLYALARKGVDLAA